MALVRRHDSRLLRVVICAMALIQTLGGNQLFAQGAGPGPEYTPLPGTVTPLAPHEPVLDIRITGNQKIKTEKVLANLGTKVGRPFDQATFERDVRTMSSRHWFVHVRPRTERVQGGVIVSLEVIERPVLESVEYHGWKAIKVRTLAKETGLKKGDPLDPYAVEDGARKMETLYHTKGFNDAKVEVLEGNKPGDRRAVYLIHEGRIQKFSDIEFVGNSRSIAPDGRLKQLIQSKLPILWVFKGRVDRQKIEEDVEKLETYYRGLGYFKAKVGRDYEYNQDEDRLKLTFYINEGPRYRVRNISFIGNQIYPEEALSYDLKLKPGEYFDQTKMTADIGNVKDLYGSHGYVFAEADPKLNFDEEPGQLDLVYQVTEGNRYKLGDVKIEIKGESPHTRYATVLNRLSMRPGDWADIRQFRSSERRLKASGLFNVDPTKGDMPKIVFSPPDPAEEVANSKNKPSAKPTGNPDTFRGQSPDDQPRRAVTLPASARPQRPATPAPVAPAAPVVRHQSPDSYGGYGGYGAGYGGPTGMQVSATPQPYSVNQPVPPQGGSYAPGYGQPAAAPNSFAPPAANPPAYGQPAYGQPVYSQPAYGQPAYGQPGVGTGGFAPGGEPIPPFNPPPLVEPNGGGMFSQQVQEAPTIPWVVTVNEAQTGRFMLGAGINSNAGLVGSIILDEQNFDWRRVPTSWEDWRSGRAFRGAGQKFRLEAAPGTLVQRYLFNFAEPYLFDTPVGLSLSGFYFNRYYRDWMEQRLGGRTGLTYLFSPDLSGGLTLRGEDVFIGEPRVNTVYDLNEVLGHSQIYSAKVSLAHDTRDSTFLPTEGHYIMADFEYAFGSLPNPNQAVPEPDRSFNFPKFTTNAQFHWLLRERPDGTGRHTLSFYNQFGISGDQTPIYERFYAGGFSTLRGFQFRGASPQDQGVQVGGIIQLLNSVEYMFPITADDMLRMVAFVDFGTVEYNLDSPWSDFRVAPGLGFRVTIPMISPAPIALDFAVPVHYNDNDLRQVFSFFVGVGR